MFGIWRNRVPRVRSQWYVPLPDFQSDADAFYDAIEAEVKAKRIPGLEIRRMPFKEGGLISAERFYLRLRREWLVFDACSAAFGTYWYFSCRGAIIPNTLRVWELVVALWALFSIWWFYWIVFGMLTGSLVMVATLVAISAFFVSAGRWQDFDDALIQLPVMGPVYEALFRRESYYRQDSRQMYLETVDSIVRAKVQEFAAAGGVHEITFKEANEPQQPQGFIELAKSFVRSMVAK